MGYRNREEAGHLLATELRKLDRDLENAVVLALPRGGVPVAFEVARRLDLPLDLMIVRKLGLPAQPELAMGAIASGGVRVLNPEVVVAAGVDDPVIAAVEERELHELERREVAYRGDRPPLRLEGRTVILVDDGVATGSTVLAAVRAVRERDSAGIVVAIPVASGEALVKLRQEADVVVCPLVPKGFLSIGAWYDAFEQLSDDRVRETLRLAWSEEDAGGHRPP